MVHHTGLIGCVCVGLILHPAPAPTRKFLSCSWPHQQKCVIFRPAPACIYGLSHSHLLNPAVCIVYERLCVWLVFIISCSVLCIAAGRSCWFPLPSTTAENEFQVPDLPFDVILIWNVPFFTRELIAAIHYTLPLPWTPSTHEHHHSVQCKHPQVTLTHVVPHIKQTKTIHFFVKCI